MDCIDHLSSKESTYRTPESVSPYHIDRFPEMNRLMALVIDHIKNFLLSRVSSANSRLILPTGLEYCTCPHRLPVVLYSLDLYPLRACLTLCNGQP